MFSVTFFCLWPWPPLRGPSPISCWHLEKGLIKGLGGLGEKWGRPPPACLGRYFFPLRQAQLTPSLRSMTFRGRCMCVCVCVCVWEREREVDKESDGVSVVQGHIETGTPSGGSGQTCSAGLSPPKSHSRLEVVEEGREGYMGQRSPGPPILMG